MIKVGITMGDPAGIGPEIVMKALSHTFERAEFFVIGDSRVLEKCIPKKATLSKYSLIDLHNVKDKTVRYGLPKAMYASAAVEYLDTAVQLYKAGTIDCLVTAPLSKEAAALSGFRFPGQTEYLAHFFKPCKPIMMLLNHRLKFSLATTHYALKSVPGLLDSDKITDCIAVTRKALMELFQISAPRIVVCGLNPHASDNGLIGEEENDILKPVIRRFEKMRVRISGPLPADTAISKAFNGEYDCVIAMYHDQALIPLKLTGGGSGVNLTLGLPLVRTSPLNGTAFDIAGKMIASCESMESAIACAISCCRNRQKQA